jgi:hypothetical protein
MNREIARALIGEELAKLRKLSYAELLKLVNNPTTIELPGSDGKNYQIERQAFWDTHKGGNIRVMVSADDGGWSAIVPLTGDFIISPDGGFIGE